MKLQFDLDKLDESDREAIAGLMYSYTERNCMLEIAIEEIADYLLETLVLHSTEW